MDKRTAKQEACFRIAMVALTALESGEDWLPDNYSTEDVPKVATAIEEVINELARRGGREPLVGG
ncbi:MAG: hypothetical protein EPO06_11700 [Burkholderiaceae bacterium]|nr:MAG: hypothetical protein EPO06_11700 [Burkholderiaceae bacterium]